MRPVLVLSIARIHISVLYILRVTHLAVMLISYLGRGFLSRLPASNRTRDDRYLQKDSIYGHEIGFSEHLNRNCFSLMMVGNC